MEEFNMTGITVPKHITKAELYNHLEELSTKRINDLDKKYKPSLTVIADKLIHCLKPEFDRMESLRTRLKETDILFMYRVTNNYNYSSLSSTVYDMNIPAHNIFIKRMDSLIQTKSEIGWAEEDWEDRPQLAEITGLWNAEVAKFAKERKESLQLKNELIRVVKSEKRAQKGFQLLVELGLDMSRFVPSKASVPAIIKPSVDISIFNDIEDK